MLLFRPLYFLHPSMKNPSIFLKFTDLGFEDSQQLWIYANGGLQLVKGSMST